MRAAPRGCQAQIDFAGPADAIALAERILAGMARRAA